MEYSKSNPSDKLKKHFSAQKEEQGGDPPKYFVAMGHDNRGEDPSGREMAAIFVKGEDGAVQQIDPPDLLEAFPEAEGDIIEAYRMAGIAVKKTDGGVEFPQMKDGGYNRGLMKEFGVEDMDGLRGKLNILPVSYERERDLKKLVPEYQTPGGL